MEKEWLEIIRRLYPVVAGMTEDEIGQLEDRIKNLPGTPNPIRVSNYAELLHLRKSIMPGIEQIGMFPAGYDLYWQGRCELLFIEQHYGACCVWARATVEMLLQEMCLSDPDTRGKFEKWAQKHNGRNPGLMDCARILRQKLEEADQRGCRILADYGDWQVHHRLDKISDEMTLEDILRKMGVSEENLRKPGFNDSRQFVMKSYRLVKGREMALTSMKELYGFLSRRATVRHSK